LCRHYPQHCAELTQFAIALALDALTAEAASEAALAQVDPSRVGPMVSRAISNVHNRLHSVQNASLAVAKETVGIVGKIRAQTCHREFSIYTKQELTKEARCAFSVLLSAI
jgi:hypothetical protein